jgi:hypothetical protein
VVSGEDLLTLDASSGMRVDRLGFSPHGKTLAGGVDPGDGMREIVHWHIVEDEMKSSDSRQDRAANSAGASGSLKAPGD